MERREVLNDKTTRHPSSRMADDAEAFVTVLTILSHPELRRVGERAALPELDQGHPVPLCRNSPRFAPPGSAWDDRPLDDPYLSRKPWQLQPALHGLDLLRDGSSIAVDLQGVAIHDRASIAKGDLDLGVTLELSDRIALLLHRVPRADFEDGESRLVASEMVGVSAGMMQVRRAIDRVADLNATVLLRGESGTGKELVAQALHRRSQRASQPFVAVDLGVLSPNLAASELFGHVKGAFTGAASARQGFFRAADGGTLFLDEVGEATPEVQAMLLRVLETRQVTPVGSHTPIPVDVRLVAATDSDLKARAQRGDFKEPLLHRLAAYVIEIPPLRQRRDDLGRLTIHLARPVLQELGEDERLERRSEDDLPWLPASLLARLARAPWEGNIRQLANVVRQLVIDSRSEPQLRETPQIRSLLTLTDDSPQTSDPVLADPDGTGEAPAKKPRADRFFRRPSDLGDDEVEEVLRACDFELTAAAKRLGIRRPSVYNLVRRHPTLRLAEDIPADELRQVLAKHSGDVEATARQLEVSRRALSRRVKRLGSD